MRELILNEIVDMVIDMSELSEQEWGLMLDFDLGIINADEEEIDLEDHERRGGQMRHWLSDCDDDTVLEVYNYLRDEFMPVALVA